MKIDGKSVRGRGRPKGTKAAFVSRARVSLDPMGEMIVRLRTDGSVEVRHVGKRMSGHVPARVLVGLALGFLPLGQSEVKV